MRSDLMRHHFHLVLVMSHPNLVAGMKWLLGGMFICIQ